MADLIPVDHDPFMGAVSSAPNFIPVDHDPFADAAPAGPTFVPVDHDPFADAAPAAPTFVPVDHDPFADAAPAAPTFVPVDHDPFAATAMRPTALGVPARDLFAADTAEAPSSVPLEQNPLAATLGSSSGLGLDNWGGSKSSDLLSTGMLQQAPASPYALPNLNSQELRQSSSAAPILPVSYHDSAKPPWWAPAPLASPFDPWADHFIKGMKGLFEFLNRSRQPLGNPDAPGCKEEWEEARSDCAKYLAMPNPPRRLTGGYTNIEDCARGLVSERCGGNPYQRKS